jgi:lathosterol oxidase
MDLALEASEKYFFTPYVYPDGFLPEDSVLRQFLSLFVLVTVGGYLLYFFAAGLCFLLVFDKRLMKHPLFLEVTYNIYMKLQHYIILCFLDILLQ